MNFFALLMVGTGGFFGSIARHVAVKSVDSRFNSFFPFGTLFVNLVGSFLLGLVIGFLYKESAGSANWKLFLATGFCGGFTTFSAFALENLNILQQKMALASIGYILLSVVAGILAVMAGVFIGKLISA